MGDLVGVDGRPLSGFDEAQRKIFEKLLFLNIEVSNGKDTHKCLAIVDVGSTQSILAASLCRELNITTEFGGIGQSFAGSLPLFVTRSTCKVSLEGGPTFSGEFTAANLPPFDLRPDLKAIIGMDDLIAAGAVLDLAEKKVTFKVQGELKSHTLTRYNFTTGEEVPPDEDECGVEIPPTEDDL